MDRLEKWVCIRIRLMAVVFVVICAGILGRAFYLQIVQGEQWHSRAERQYQKVVPLAPQRGTIFDRNGEPMAISLEVDSVYIEPKRVGDPLREAQLLSSTLDLPYAAVKDKLVSSKGFLWLKRQIAPQESLRIAQLIREKQLPGINLAKEHQRFYPNAQVGAQLIGFTGLDPKGLEGLELKYNQTLLGRDGFLVTEQDALGRGIGASDRQGAVDNGFAHLRLTLDKNIQYLAEKELAAGIAASNSRAGCVVVLEPSTGKVLAMANVPEFNPNMVSRHAPAEWRNRALVDTFEPGSTMKVFLLAAALNEKAITPGQRIFCENGTFCVGGKVIHDHSAHGWLSVTDVLKFSSNIGSAKIGKSLGKERLHRYLSDFGFGKPTGVDLPGESGGLLRPPNKWFEIDLAAISFGQAVTVTPLQLAGAMTAIANGGKLMQPYLVERVVDEAGEVIEERQPRVLRQVVSAAAADTVRDMMVTVTEQGGTGTLAVVPGYRTAGKTGTAQKVDPVTGGYSADKRVASFVGFIPAEAPKLVILVMLDEPKGQVYGGLVAAPIFSRVASQTLQYLGVPPTCPEDKEKLLPSQDAVELLIQQAQAQGEEGEPLLDPVEVDANGEALVAPVYSGPTMPNFVGQSGRQVLQAIEQTGINVKLMGSGRVVEQQPLPGRPIPYDSEVWVRLEPPAST